MFEFLKGVWLWVSGPVRPIVPFAVGGARLREIGAEFPIIAKT
jgi:hypothetical protein